MPTRIISLILSSLCLCSCLQGQDLTPTRTSVSFMASTVDSKTVFGPLGEGQYPTLWSGNERLAVSYNWGTPVMSSTVSAQGSTATFSASITRNDAASTHAFYVLSPVAAVTGVSASGFAVTVPGEQNPGNGTPDEAAQLIYASHSSASFETSINLHFSHVLAYGNMTVMLPEGVSAVNGYTISANTPLSGDFSYDGNALSAVDGSQKYIELNTTKSSEVFFALAPCILSGSYITLKLKASDGKTYTRTVDLAAKTLTFSKGRVTKFTINMSAVAPDAPAAAMGLAFAEIPGARENSSWECHIHDKLPSNASLRNYSFCFDRDKHCSMWVAWPLHAAWMGSADRTDAFGYDPVFVDDQYEANIGKNAYYPQGGSSYSHSRGHQLPSADRTCSQNDNKTTFYATNMTPQLQSLNGGAWEQLEALERSWCGDTLYIVTGPLFDSSVAATYAYDNKGIGKACQVPTHYWKIFLRVKPGTVQKDVTKCSASELQCVGFIFKHDSTRSGKTVYSTDMRSVADIEALTGFTFFVNVPNAPKSSYTVSDWPGVN